MPKRATHTFESDKDGLHEDGLNTYFCMCCGESVLILGPGVQLTSLPRRRTDGATVLDRSSTVFKLNSKRGERKIIRRAKGYERQFRLNCWNCDVPMCYRCEDSAEAPLTYVLPEAMGTQADLYLQLYQVPPCIQSTGPLSVRLALEVTPEQPKKAVTHVNNAEVGVAVCAPAREGLANAEVLELLVRVLSVTRQQLQLSRGVSPKSRFLLVSGMSAVDVFKKLRASVETDMLPVSTPVGGVPGPGADDVGPAATAGAASSVARRQWEMGEDLDDLAAPPSIKQQTFRN